MVTGASGAGGGGGASAIIDQFTKGTSAASDAGEESNKITNKVNEQQTEALGAETAAGRPDADTAIAHASGRGETPPAQAQPSAPGSSGAAVANADADTRLA